MLGKTSWYSIDVIGNDRHILLFYKKCHFCHLLPFGKVGQNSRRGVEKEYSIALGQCISCYTMPNSSYTCDRW